MSSWITKIRGQIERLNPKLTVTESNNTLIINHSEYGFITSIEEDDAQPLKIIREILTEVSANVKD